MCTVKINDKYKINLPPPPFHSFLNCWKTAKSTKSLKFSEFKFVFWQISSNCISRLFCVANLFEVGRKILWILTPFKSKWSKIFQNNCQDKNVLVKMTLKVAINQKVRKKSIKIRTFFKRCVSIILWSFSSWLISRNLVIFIWVIIIV